MLLATGESLVAARLHGPAVSWWRETTIREALKDYGRAFLVSKVKVKIRVSNGPLFHLVPATGRLLRGSGRGGLASLGLSRLGGARSGRVRR